MSRRLVLVIVAAASALACHKHRHYEKEEAGGAPKFHDQRLAPTIAVTPQAPRPVALALDVSADAIHIDDGEHWTSYPRRGGGQPIVQPSRGRLIPVVGDDSLMAWAGQREIVAAHSNDLDHSWTVLDYAPEQAVAPPLVVGGRVAVVTTNAILHAPLDPSTNADGPGRLALGFTPKTPPRSDGRRLVWAAVDGGSASRATHSRGSSRTTSARSRPTTACSSGSKRTACMSRGSRRSSFRSTNSRSRRPDCGMVGRTGGGLLD